MPRPPTVLQTDRGHETVGADGLVSAVHEVAAVLDLVQRTLDAEDARAGRHLQAASEELRVIEEEMTAQLAELGSAAQALQDERHLTGRLLANLPIPLLQTDEHGAILDANPAAADLLGVTVSGLTRKPLFAFVDGDSRRVGRTLLRQAVRSGESAEGVLTLTPRGGETVSCQVTLVPVAGRLIRLTNPTRVDLVRWVVAPPGPAGGAVDTAAHLTLVELCRMGVGDADLRTLLRRIAELTCEGVPQVDATSVMLGDPARPEVVASSSALAQACDGVQHILGAGPLFDAHASGRAIGTPDLLDDARWPDLAQRREGDHPAHGCVALPLVLDGDTVGVVALYRRGGGLNATEVEARAQPYVAAAQTLVRDSRLIQEMALVREQLQQALTSRAVIDQAKGMVMMTRKCSADEAFALLTRMSNAGNRKLRDIAREIVTQASGGAEQPSDAPGLSPRRSSR